MPLVTRHFTTPDTDPFSTVTWSQRRITFTDSTHTFDEVVEAPDSWSNRAIQIAVTKYGAIYDDGTRELSIRTLIRRVAGTIATMGVAQQYFATPDESDIFLSELTYILLHQYAAYNSPVWMNFGAPHHKQTASACYVLDLHDTLEDIMRVATEQALVYRDGAGAGVSLSVLRGSMESLAGGGHSCFPADTRIHTTRGMVRISDVLPGKDKAIVPGVGPCQITHLHANGVRHVITITLSDHRTITTTPDHQFYIATSEGEIVKRQLKDIINDPSVRLLSSLETTEQSAYASEAEPFRVVGSSARPYRNAAFDFVITPELAWVLGYHLGNGCTTRGIRRSSMTFTCPSSQPKYAQYLTAILQRANLNPRYKEEPQQGRITVVVSNSALVDVLDRHGLLKDKSQTARIPIAIYTMPADTQAAFIAGYFDADGHQEVKDRISIKTTSPDLVDDLQQLMVALGIRTTVSTYVTKQRGNYPAHRISVSGNHSRTTFVDTIGPHSLKLSDNTATEGKNKLGSFPFNALKLFISDSKLRTRLALTTLPYNAKETGIGTLRKLYDALIDSGAHADAAKIKPFLSYAPVSIVNVQDGTECDVYDITVENEHRYCVNGILVSNSGPLSFATIYNAVTGVVRSGGRVRRAALLLNLACDHPDIRDFAIMKAKEEVKATFMLDCVSLLRDVVRLNGELVDPIMLSLAREFQKTEQPETLAAMTLMRELTDTLPADYTALMTDPGWDQFSENIAYTTVGYQNMNISVAATDAFMQAAIDDLDWYLIGRKVIPAPPTTNPVIQTPQGTVSVERGVHTAILGEDGAWHAIVAAVKAKALLHTIAQAAHACGDPGIQFMDTIQKMSTVVEDITSSNPCFTAETPVVTDLGTLPIAELVGQYFYALSYDQQANKKVFKRATAFKTHDATAVISVTLDDGTIIRCTPNHRFFVRRHSSAAWSTGTWVEAKDLKPGASLCPTGLFTNTKNRLCVSDSNGDYTSYSQIHQMVAYAAYGSKPEGYHVHHTDDNKANNAAANLEYLPQREHDALKMLGDNNPMCRMPEKNWLIKQDWAGEKNGRYSGHTNDQLIEHGRALYQQHGKFTTGLWKEYAREHGLPTGVRNEFRFGSFSNFKSLVIGNHKVVSVVDHGEIEAVYDLTVEDTHNFFAGDVCVHNCGESLLPNNTSCNLASLRLTKFYDGAFDIAAFEHVARIVSLGQEIIIDGSEYPTTAIAENTKRFRALGLGFCDLGALLMRMGLPYDSDDGRAVAASISGLLTGSAYKMSQDVAALKGTYDAYTPEQVAKILQNQRAYIRLLGKRTKRIAGDICHRAGQLYTELVQNPAVRNSHVTALAPTGTIGFLMDSDTTGVEPVFAFASTKHLVGGGELAMVCSSADAALSALDYTLSERQVIAHGALRGDFSGILPEHLPIFQTAVGANSISWSGHVKMVAAVQPVISMGISKSVNVPGSATIEDIEAVYIAAWQLGVKSITVYRDGSKRLQPLKTIEVAEEQGTEHFAEWFEEAERRSKIRDRRSLPVDRDAKTHKFAIGGHDGYLTVGLYDDGTPGEIFIKMSKQGSTVSGLMDALAVTISLALQFDVPLSLILDKLQHMRFEPAGWTENPEIRVAKSIVDYIARYMALKFLKRESAADSAMVATLTPPDMEAVVEMGLNGHREHSGMLCQACGGLLQASGTCMVCSECGSTAGGCG